jgi:hypothetical protein
MEIKLSKISMKFHLKYFQFWVQKKNRVNSIMLGLTRKQFLKRSKTCINETGNNALLISELINLEKEEKIDNQEAYQRIKGIMNGVEKTFFKYEVLSPPDNCVSLHLKILHSLITLQESVAANYDYIVFSTDHGKEKAEKLEESIILLDKFRMEFEPITTEVDSSLMK